MRRDYPGYFVDTNVVLYAYDPRDRSKQRRAKEVLYRLGVTQAAALSAQVLAEFVSVSTSKLRAHITIDEVVEQVERWTRAFTILHLTPMVVLEAARGVRSHQLSYWDAQIWATAKLHQIQTVLSEDFADGRTIEGVTFVDPFRPGFDLASLA